MIYEGNENYIFITYAHSDSDKVLPYIRMLNDDNFRVWYDAGIEAGSEWPAYVEDRLLGAEILLVFMTQNVVESENCRNEINLALDERKKIFIIYLEPTTLKYGLRLRLSTTQSLYRQNCTTEEDFTSKLLSAQILKGCKRPAEISYKSVAKKSSEYDIFISCSNKDLAEAESVKNALVQNGISVRTVDNNLSAYYGYSSEITSAISQSDTFLLLLSDAAQQSEHVRIELAYAVKLKKRIVPFMIEDCRLTEEFRYFIAKFQMIVAYKNRQIALENLVKAISPDASFVQPQKKTGTIPFANGGSYEGNRINGIRNGEGRFARSDGYVEQGEFADGNLYNGVVYNKKGEIVQKCTNGMRFAPDIPIPIKTVTYPSGNVYVGEVIDGIKHGKGTYTIASNGTVLKGDFIKGKFTDGFEYDKNGKLVARYTNGKRTEI